MYTIAAIDQEISKLEAQIKDLKAERAQVLKEQKRLALSPELASLLVLVMQNPGITKEDLVASTGIDEKVYNNKMTGLRRRGLVSNMGTRKFPFWYATQLNAV
jgi:predicted HTH transcriptional regulator